MTDLLYQNKYLFLDQNIKVTLENCQNESTKIKVEFSFGYREMNDSIKIFLHHSSIPYKL